MSKQHAAVRCSVAFDHNDNRLILTPTEDSLAELKEMARSARLEVDFPVEFELADVKIVEEEPAPDAKSTPPVA